MKTITATAFLCAAIVAASFTGCASSGAVGGGGQNLGFRVTPYLQNPAPDAMSVIWFSDSSGKAKIRWWREDGKGREGSAKVSGIKEEALAGSGTIPFKFRHRMRGLEPSTRYCYEVRLPGGATYSNSFITVPPEGSGALRIVAYADSETEPSSTGAFVAWEDYAEDGDTNTWGAVTCKRRYYIDQTDGFASNIVSMQKFAPDLIVVAGDIVQTGSRQADWDEYWRHNAGDINNPAGSTPIFAAPGNHDYNNYFEALGGLFGEVGMAKFRAYFESNPNGASNPLHNGRYHRLDYGPATIIAIDCNNGPDDDPSLGPKCRDTSFYLKSGTCAAPDFNPGSEQYAWLEEQLKDAQRKSKFTFLVSHHCPFSVGYHGRLPGEQGLSKELEPEYLSGAPVRCLTNLLFKYGVDAWICGHDELYEHSVIKGTERLPDGTERPHEVHVYDVGVGGDGLRGCRRTLRPNPYEIFRAHKDAPEIYGEDGILVSGGKHYGHLEIAVDREEDGIYSSVMRMAYVFVTTNRQGKACGFETRHYPDEVKLRSR